MVIPKGTTGILSKEMSVVKFRSTYRKATFCLAHHWGAADYSFTEY
jgi:hypothetical protein